MSGANVFIHASQFPDAVRRELLRSLRARRINHKFHYDSNKQATKWLAVHEAHSPARTHRDCLRVYDDAFAATAKTFARQRVQVIGLGCGGGQKDLRLIELLRRAGAKVRYAPVDVSVPLVLVARERALKLLSDADIMPVSCDLAVADDFAQVLPARAKEKRLVTFFGMIPNFEPAHILPRLAQFLRAGDTLLFSANLLPAPHDARAMGRILPQYDNAETREWLLTFLLDLGLERRDGALTFSIERKPARGRDALWRFVARYKFHRTGSLRVDDHVVPFRRGEVWQLFFSYRHTPETVTRWLAREGLAVGAQWVAESGEEGVFHCERVHRRHGKPPEIG
jgi:L-histidine Nalpha-methyltransferase